MSTPVSQNIPPICGDLPADYPAFPIFNNGKEYKHLGDFKYPWENRYTLPEYVKDKKSYQQAHSKTEDIIFPHFSTFRGTNPHGHITSENPIHEILGVVGDYDAALTDEEFSAGARLDPVRKPYPPFAYNRTFSKGARAVWVFSEPIAIMDEVFEDFAQYVKSKLKVTQYWKGLDDKQLTRESQTCVCGTDWTVLKYQIPAAVARLWLFEVLKNRQFKFTGDVIVPFEKLNEWYQEGLQAGKYWDIGGELKPGLRCQRFWARPENRGTHLDTSIVYENGVYCNTGPVRWMSWRAIFGNRVEEFRVRALDDASKAVWYSPDMGAYYTQTVSGKWKPTEATMLKTILKQMGFSDQKPKGSFTSPLEDMLVHLEKDDTRHVVAAAPFALNPNQIVTWNGLRYLNTATVKLLKSSPAPGEFPWLKAYFEHLFPNVKTREHFFAWLRHWYKTAKEGKPTRGQAIFICGGTSCGKTFLSNIILARIFGGYEIATQAALGKHNFNSALAEKALWVIDDGDSFASGSAVHTQLTNFVKATVANPSTKFEKKFGYSCALPFEGRLVTTLNSDERSITILPEPIQSILDKVNFYSATEEKMGDWDSDELDRELPFFLNWLEGSQPAAWITPDKRFGITAFHEALLLRRAKASTKSATYLDVLAELVRIKQRAHYSATNKGKAKYWSGKMKATTVAQEINSNPTLKDMLGGRPVHPKWFYREIADDVLAGQVPWVKGGTEHKQAILEFDGSLMEGLEEDPPY